MLWQLKSQWYKKYIQCYNIQPSHPHFQHPHLVPPFKNSSYTPPRHQLVSRNIFRNIAAFVQMLKGILTGQK